MSVSLRRCGRSFAVAAEFRGLRLVDLRRLHPSRWGYLDPWYTWIWEADPRLAAVRYSDVRRSFSGDLEPIHKALDRLISIYGPGAPANCSWRPERPAPSPSEREHKINTEEVVQGEPAGVEDANKHGGDSSSGEVPEGSSTEGSESESESDTSTGGGAAAGQDSAHSGGEPPEQRSQDPGPPADWQASASPEHTLDQQQQQVRPDGGADVQDRGCRDSRPADAAGEGDAWPGRPSDSDVSAESEPETGEERAHSPQDDLGEEISPDAEVSPAGDASYSSRAGRCVWGGWFRPREQRRADPWLLRQAKMALRRLLDVEVGAGIEPSPRIAPRALVREMVSRRVNLSRAHREELVDERLLLAIDCSGSCSSTCGEMSYAAEIVAAADPRMVLIYHSNGFPAVVAADRREIRVEDSYPVRGDGDAGTAEMWINVIHRYNCVSAVWFGDGDPIWLWEQIAPHFRRIIWADSWRARIYDYQPRRVRAPYQISRELRRKAEYWAGVSQAEAAIEVLRQSAVRR